MVHFRTILTKNKCLLERIIIFGSQRGREAKTIHVASGIDPCYSGVFKKTTLPFTTLFQLIILMLICVYQYRPIIL